ncbi:MAG: hypothetical protein ACK4P2_06055 [Hyphomonas sp.]
MGSFDFVLLLLSFVYALALGHFLTRLGVLLLARDRVRVSGLLALAMLNAVTQIFIGWLALWDFRDATSWDLYTVTLFFISSILIFLMAASVSPDATAEGEVDLEAFYWKNYKLFYALYVGLLVAYIAMCAVYLRTSQPELAWQQATANIPYLIVSLIAIYVPSRWVQWAMGLVLFAMSTAWAIAFNTSIH